MSKKKPKPDGITVTTPGIQFRDGTGYVTSDEVIDALAVRTRASQPKATGVIIWFDPAPTTHRYLRILTAMAGLATIARSRSKRPKH